MTLKDILRKITSRKFFAMLSVLIISVLLLFRVDATVVEKIGAAVVMLGDVVAYVFAESIADAARAKKIEQDDEKDD